MRARRRAAASIRSRNTSRSTPRTSCSSAAAPSTAWRRSSRRAPAGGRSGSAATAEPRRPTGGVNKTPFAEVEPDDLLRYGLIPELVGRLPVTVALEALDEEALVRILKEPKNALTKQYTKLFELEEVKLTFEESALRAIAAKALKRGTGARGLRAILEEILTDVMFDLPTREDVEEVKLTEALACSTERRRCWRSRRSGRRKRRRVGRSVGRENFDGGPERTVRRFPCRLSAASSSYRPPKPRYLSPMPILTPDGERVPIGNRLAGAAAARRRVLPLHRHAAARGAARVGGGHGRGRRRRSTLAPKAVRYLLAVPARAEATNPRPPTCIGWAWWCASCSAPRLPNGTTKVLLEGWRARRDRAFSQAGRRPCAPRWRRRCRASPDARAAPADRPGAARRCRNSRSMSRCSAAFRARWSRWCRARRRRAPAYAAIAAHLSLGTSARQKLLEAAVADRRSPRARRRC